MSRIEAFIVTKEVAKTERMIFTGTWIPDSAEYDSAEATITFYVPSRSRPIVYGLTIDAATSEAVCACEHFEYRINTVKEREAHGTQLEKLAWEKRGVRLLPSICRKPAGLCAHLNAARRWLKRHKLYKVLENIEAYQLHRLEAMPERQVRSA